MSRQCYYDPECAHDATWIIDRRHICPEHLFAAWQQCLQPDSSDDAQAARKKCRHCGAGGWLDLPCAEECRRDTAGNEEEP